QTVAQMEMEAAAWAGYYEKLAQAIQAANAPPPASVTSAAPRNDPAARAPLVRYVGSWMYPATNGVFHGTQPESIELEVHENSGRVNGTLLGRFRPTPGTITNLAVRFEFEGDLGPAATQKFTLMTPDGARGTIELIPGPAFNLLEVNFQTDSEPNRIRNGNFILVKK